MNEWEIIYDGYLPCWTSKKCGGSVLGSENMIICIYLKMHFGLITIYLQNFCSPKKLKYIFYPTSFCSKTDILKNDLTVFAHTVKASGVQNNFGLSL